MHLNKITKELRNKIIAGVMAFVMAIGGVIGWKNQQNKINDLQHQLQLKRQIESQYARGYTESTIDAKTIKGEFNKLCDYSILKDYKVTMTHTYDFTKDGRLGIKRRGVLSGSATCVYDIDIRLSTADIYKDDKGVVHVELERPFLNENSVHLEENTFLINEKKSSMNMWMRKEEGQEIMMYWTNSFNTSAVEKLKDYYEEDYQRDKLEAIAKKEIGNLLQTLKVEKYKITIK